MIVMVICVLICSKLFKRNLFIKRYGVNNYNADYFEPTLIQNEW